MILVIDMIGDKVPKEMDVDFIYELLAGVLQNYKSKYIEKYDEFIVLLMGIYS